jgi:hypothetical protein
MENVMASPERRLRDLQRSEVFAADFPRRRHLTHAEWAGLSEDEQLEARSPQTAAIRRAKDYRPLVDLITDIGKARQESAVPLLAKLWSDCPLVPARIATGHALRAIGNRKARAALLSLIEDSDHLSVFLAVRSIFDDAPASAFDRFAPYFEKRRVSEPGGRVIPAEVLRTFGPVWRKQRGPEEPHWTMAEPGWFAEDERWMDLCVRLRRDDHLGRAARAVLRLVDASRVRTRLSLARVQEGPRWERSRSTASGDLLARYRRGEHEAVWTELRAHPAIDGDFRAEALAVATETMSRVARCADLIAERLAAKGWVALGGRLRWPPSAHDQQIIDDIEQFTAAPLPPSLVAFWNVVGGIDFVWNYNKAEPAPDLGLDLALVELDPLDVCPPPHTSYLFKEWKERRSEVDPDLDDPFNLDLAPDYLHKANFSGGGPYGIELPDLGADPIFVNERHGLPFVDYLRLAFRWGGFPRLERHTEKTGVRNFVAEMTRELEPF